MDIRSPQNLKEHARRALTRGREPKKTIAAYTGILILSSLAVNLAGLWLNAQYDGAGGLSNRGIRSILSTVETVLPMVQFLLVLAVEYGYLYAMMRIARGQYADHTDLKMGLRRLASILRLWLLEGLFFFALAVAAFYIATVVIILTPWGEPLAEFMAPMTATSVPVLDEAALAQALKALTPVYIAFSVIYLAALIPFLFLFRMANYILMDTPRTGAFAALVNSFKMMTRNLWHLLKLDLSFWWYYVLDALVSVLNYLPLLLPLVGIVLPFTATVNSLLFYALSLVAQFILLWFFRNELETTYIMAYECIHEKPKKDGVVLGNIFDV